MVWLVLRKHFVPGFHTKQRIHFMRILLAVDQSKDSKGVIRLLQKLKWPAGSTLNLLHVTALGDAMATAGSSRLPKKQRDDSEKLSPAVQSELHRLEEQLASDTLQVQSMVLSGVPGKEILGVIQKKKIDLVVVGSRGLSRISGLLLGSVSAWVLNDSRCSALIGRPTSHKTKSSSSLKVLLAIDGSQDSWKAVKFLKEIELPAGSTVTLLHVVRKHVYETEQCVDRGEKSQTEFAKLVKQLCHDRGALGVDLLKQTRKELDSLQFTIRERIAFGHEAQEILKTAKQQKVDLVLMGSKGISGLRRLLMGSVAQTVSQHAPCSVLIVRSSKKP